jgi:general L-amino acid transport system permease protein
MSDSFVRTNHASAKPAPHIQIGWVRWVRENLFSSLFNSLLTVAAMCIILLALPPFLDWAVFSAVFSAVDGSACRVDGAGACWAFVEAKFGQFLFGRYPVDERWRVILTLVLGIAGLAPLLIPNRLPRKWFVAYLLLPFPALAFVLLSGGLFGLEKVETSDWGGLMVTLVVALTGIAASLPLGVLLALGRRSEMPIVRILSVMFIEFWRGVPLITVLFMSSVMLPLFLPEGMSFDKLLRALIGVALFSSAYMAEVVRGGLAAVPAGQYEAGKAIGLTYWQSMSRIVLPQALTTVIPGIVNNFIGLFKDTTLVLVIGLFDLLGIVQSNSTDPTWLSPQTSTTGYVFAAFVFWVFCFGMSRYSVFMERRLEAGVQR